MSKFKAVLVAVALGFAASFNFPRNSLTAKNNVGPTETNHDITYDLDFPTKGVVDWRAGLCDKEVVLHKDNTKYYDVTLTKSAHIEVEVEDGVVYYRIQLLRTRNSDRFWVFRSWGRIGMLYGNQLLSEHESEKDAVQLFTQTFLDKTGNEWGGPSFHKKSGLYDIVFWQREDEAQHLPKNVMLQPSLTNSKLPIPVQELIAKIFSKKGKKKRHIFERKEKSKGLDNPCEIYLAYDDLKATCGVESQGQPISSGVDTCHDSLSTDFVQILPTKGVTEYERILEYFTDSQSPIHNYKLLMTNIFRVTRHGEEERFFPFKHFRNRRLLWHGTRTTHVAGILSHGLKISPPPGVKDYKSRGMYFTDVVTKAARYSGMLSPSETGILLLCEVALGNMAENKKKSSGMYTEDNLYPEFNSIKGVGKYGFSDMETLQEDGMQIPLGNPKKRSDAHDMFFLHNEYVVFDEAQIKIKYLITFKIEDKNTIKND